MYSTRRASNEKSKNSNTTRINNSVSVEGDIGSLCGGEFDEEFNTVAFNPVEWVADSLRALPAMYRHCRHLPRLTGSSRTSMQCLRQRTSSSVVRCFEHFTNGNRPKTIVDVSKAKKSTKVQPREIVALSWTSLLVETDETPEPKPVCTSTKRDKVGVLSWHPCASHRECWHREMPGTEVTSDDSGHHD